MWQLVINGPGYFDTPYPLPEGTTCLGRAEDNDIVLSGELVSRRHAKLHVRGGAVQVEDLGSRNGSRLNGEPLEGTHPLSAGDVLTIGENALAVRRPDPTEQAPLELEEALGGQLLLSRDVRESVVVRALGNTPRHVLEGAQPAPAGLSMLATPEPLVLLFQVAESLARCPSLSAFLDEVCDALVAHAHAGTAAVLLRQEDGVLAVEAARRPAGTGEVALSSSVVDEALRTGSTLVVADVGRDARFASRESVVRSGGGAVVCVPLGDSAPFLGALYVQGAFRSTSPGALADVATTVGRLVTVALSHFEASGGGAPGLQLRALLSRMGAGERPERLLEVLSRTQSTRALEERSATVLRVELTGPLARLSPTAARRVLHAFHVHLGEVVRAHGGLLETVGEEGARAVFGLLEEGGAPAVAAVRAALELRGTWEEVCAEWPPTERCALRAGLAGGRVLVGEVGSEARPDVGLTGPACATAAGLCQLAQGGQVLLSGTTLAAVGVRFEVEPLGEQALGGERVAAFAVLEEDGGQSP